MYALVVVGASSMLARLRRAGTIERQQIKWFASATVVVISGVVLKNTVYPAVGVAWVWWVGLILTAVGVVSSPVAMGIAIFRYRLYQIDLIINRTLVYGSLTAVLAAVYLGGVVILQYAFRALTGEGSQLAVVASTLIIAALFIPLGRRIQGFIDSRFYRRKYDARKTLESFSAKLRNQTNLDALSEDLVGVVGRRCSQPTSLCGCVLTRLLEASRQPSTLLTEVPRRSGVFGSSVKRAEVGAPEGQKYVLLTMCKAKGSAIVILKTETHRGGWGEQKAKKGTDD
jgi:hypothetical protein